MKSKRKFPQAKPDKNNGVKLTMVVKTRSPIEAYHMLRQGQPIDQAIGYYVENGVLDKDIFLMDNVEKLHTLAKFRELKEQHKSDIEQMVSDYEQQQQAAQAAQQEVIKQ